MATIEETPGCLIIENSPANNEYIHHVILDNIELIPGVCMAATIQMNIEYMFRLKQIINLRSESASTPLMQ